MYIHATDYKFKHIYNIETLKDYNNYCEKDIKRLNELIEKVRKYQIDLFNHVQEVLQTDIKKVVTLVRRENWSTKRVEYYVTLEHRPQVNKEYIDNEKVYGKYTDQKNFKGTERNIAIKYAEQLAKTNYCTIERKGFK